MSVSTVMTKGERDDLAKLIRNQAKVAKAMAVERSSQLLADFENQMATIYHFDDDDVWDAAEEMARRAVAEAKAIIARRCAEMGILPECAPDLSMSWYGRGSNACAQRRGELRKVAKAKIDAMEQKARREIEKVSVDAQARVIVAGLTTDAAQVMLATLPKAADLMPAITVDDIQALMPGLKRQKSEEYRALWADTTALLSADPVDDPI